jgi:hypothetical protein
VTRSNGFSPPRLLAATNYTWDPPPQGAIPALEAQASRASYLHRRFSQEANIVWDLLARKESDFMNPLDPRDAEERLAARKSVELLGMLHYDLWEDAAKSDGVVTNARKRIQLLQAAQHNVKPTKSGLEQANGHTSNDRTLTFAIGLAKSIHERVEVRKILLRRASEEVAQVLAEKRAFAIPAAPTPSGGPLILVREEETLREIRRKFEEGVDTAVFDAEIVRKVLMVLEREQWS